ncbi:MULTISPECIES: T9SS type A sorting domain-containing protein [Mesonia]|uniref:T9SS type A sorting domain-containing protein n=1 Tax=Mesonia TaxID=232115 RepID=UPI000C8A8F0F|nr:MULTISPECIES: T9SS type A sorting domain-containing protein [Mesonia]MAN26679.1 hypothetical protein [Mesonia sp.]MAQ39798.1 hypothetical protein [Mesonia sp.]
MSSQTHNQSISLTAIGEETGYVTLQARMGSEFCRSVMVKTKKLFVGSPKVGVQRLTSEEYCDIKYHYLVFKANSTSNFVSYQWLYPINFPSIQAYEEGNILRLGIPKNDYDNFAVSVQVENDCGNDFGSWSGAITQCNSSKTSRMATEDVSVTPNPKNMGESISVDLLNNINNIIIEKIEVYDLTGQTRFSQNYSEGSININALNLSQGNYILNIFTSDNEVYQKLIIIE